MTETFSWKVISDSSGGGEFVTSAASFGDGYVQEVPLGINNEIQKWSVIFAGSYEEALEVVTFIRDHMGATPFYWTPPLGVQGYYKCKSYKPTQNGIRWRVTMQFEQTAVP